MADILPVFGPNCRNKYMLTSSFGSINIEILEGLSKIALSKYQVASGSYVGPDDANQNSQSHSIVHSQSTAFNIFLPHIKHETDSLI